MTDEKPNGEVEVNTNKAMASKKARNRGNVDEVAGRTRRSVAAARSSVRNTAGKAKQERAKR